MLIKLGLDRYLKVRQQTGEMLLSVSALSASPWHGVSVDQRYHLMIPQLKLIDIKLPTPFVFFAFLLFDFIMMISPQCQTPAPPPLN